MIRNNAQNHRKEKKTLGAIVPIYNVEKYLTDCIESLVNQTEPFDEILLIDDGSKDGCLDICKRYQTYYANIKVYSYDNLGVSYTRNFGIERCECDYILFLDSDDILKNNIVEIIKEKISEEDYDMVLYDAEIKCENGFVRNYNSYDRSKYFSMNQMTGQEFLVRSFPDCYSTVIYLAVYKKEYLYEKKIQFQAEVSYSEDAIFIVESLLKADKIYYIPLKLYIRRIRENSIMTSELNIKKVRDSIIVADKMAGIICSYLHDSKNYIDKYVSLVLFHYNAALQLQVLADNKMFHISINDKKCYLQSLVCFLNETLIIWKKGDNISNIYMAFNLLKSYEKLYSSDFVSKNESVDKILLRLQQEKEQHLIRKLNKLPLKKKNTTIALYGAGKATETILTLYEENIGLIECNLIIIETNKRNLLNYIEFPVYSVDEIPNFVELIIITSYKYRKEMISELIKNDVKTNIVDICEDEYFEVVW